MATASEERPPNLPSASEERQPNLPSASEERPPNLLSASEEKLPSDCDCQNLFLKLKRKPADEGAQKCCKHSKCTVAQLMKLCQMDPDCIMDLFKIAKWDEKCLPDVEMDQEGANRNEDAKYHFLMVDNSTQGSESTSEKIVEERINEVKSIFQHSIVASTATDTDRNRFNKILWPVSVEDTPEICSVRLEESSLKTNETQPEKPKAEEKMPPAQDQEQVPKEVMNSQTRGPQDPGEPPRKTVQKHIEKMNVWMQTQKPVPAETDSLTMEIFKRRNSPDLSETQTPSILRNMEGSKEEDSFSNSKATVRRRKSIIKTQSITETDRERARSIVWSENANESSSNSESIRTKKHRPSTDSFSHLSVVVREIKRRQSSATAVPEETPKRRVQIVHSDVKDTNRGRGMWERFRSCMGSRKKRDNII